MKAVRCAQHDCLEVPLKELRVDVIGAYRYYLAAKIERAKRIDHYLAALVAFKFIGACVFEGRDDVINRRFFGVRGVLMQLHAVGWIGRFGTRDYKAGTFIKYEHVNLHEDDERVQQSLPWFFPAAMCISILTATSA